MKLAVIGSRSFTDYDQLKTLLKDHGITEIISGGASGADFLAERFAREHHLKLTVFRPDWDTHGRAAGIIRNRTIVDVADAVVAFWDGASRGTAFTIKYAQAQNKPIEIIQYDSSR